MELSKLCTKYFECCDLYDVLGVHKKCDATEVKQAFFKRSLKYYYNKVISADEDEVRHNAIENEEAFEKFKTLLKVYSVLSDKERKWVYEETGCVWLDEELSKENFNWIGLWKLVFDNPNRESIASFVNSYTGSEEEAIDIKKLYKLYKGDESKIMKIVLFLTPEDESRIRDVIRRKHCKDFRSKVLKLSMKQVKQPSSVVIYHNSVEPQVSTSEESSSSTTHVKTLQTEPPRSPLTDALKSKGCQIKSDALVARSAKRVKSDSFEKQMIDKLLHILENCETEREKQAAQLAKKPKSSAFEEQIIESALQKLRESKVKRENPTAQPDEKTRSALTHPIEIIDKALEKSKTVKNERVTEPNNKDTSWMIMKSMEIDKTVPNLHENRCVEIVLGKKIKKEKENFALEHY